MSVKSAPYYWLECDHEGCGLKSTYGGEYTAWSDESGAIEDATGSGWLIIDGKHYCDQHWREHDCDGSSNCEATAHVEGCFGDIEKAKEVSEP